MKPNINVPAGITDLEKPHVHVSNIKVGSGQLIDNSVTAAKVVAGAIDSSKIDYWIPFWYIIDGGVIDGLTNATVGTWTPKNIDGGIM